MAASDPSAFVEDAALIATYGPLPSTERGHGLHIGAHPGGDYIVYPCQKFVVVRCLSDPSDCFLYRGHNEVVTVAKFNPEGDYIASADASGKVRVWEFGGSHTLKSELIGIGGSVKDLAWSPDGEMMVTVGESTSQFGRVFNVTRGNNEGEIAGHSKRIISCDWRQQNPESILTGGEDSIVGFFKGPPFVFHHTVTDHRNYVNCIRYSPDGTWAVSVGSDKKVFIYDGVTGERLRETDESHSGSVYNVAWSSDSQRFLTASADKSVKIFDQSDGRLLKTVTIGRDVADMQLSAVWAGDNILSVSTSGEINYYAMESDSPIRIIEGHQTAISSLNVVRGRETMIFSGSIDGVICRWEEGLATRLKGQLRSSIQRAAHGGKVTGVTFIPPSQIRRGSTPLIASIGWDDKLRLASPDTNAYTEEVDLGAQPCDMAVTPNGYLFIATNRSVLMYDGSTKIAEVAISAYTPTCISTAFEEEVAVGGDDNKIHTFTIDKTNLVDTGSIEGHRAAISVVKYNDQGSLIASGDIARMVNVFTRGSGVPRVPLGSWTYHTTRVAGLSWHPNGMNIITGSSDGNLCLWNVEKPRKRQPITFAHKDGVTGVAFISEDTVISSGNDCTLFTWNVGERLAAIE